MASAEAVSRDQSVSLAVACAAEPVRIPSSLSASEDSRLQQEGCVPVCVSIRPAAGVERTPLDICCVLDISWSMSMEATVQSASGATETGGLSLMDVAKHAIRTIVQSLGENDRLSIVTFAGTSKIVIPLTDMNAAGKETAEQAMKNIGFDSDTLLWTGLSKGLETLQAAPRQNRLSHLMLLTDGEAKDKGTVMQSLSDYKAKNEGLPGSICTFGIGYEIDSELLCQVSSFADGSFAFIPDAGFVGTIFVNTISNLMVTMGKDALLTLEADGGAKVEAVMGNWGSEVSSDGIWRLNLGNLQYDQSKDIVLLVRMPTGKNSSEVGSFLFASLEYTVRHDVADKRVRCQAEGNGSTVDATAAAAVETHRCRALFVDALALASSKAGQRTEQGPGHPLLEAALGEARAVVQDLAAELQASKQADSAELKALIEDARGQSSEALSRADWYKKWGRHYLPSIMLAHKLQQCNNFKDPGVQEYGGALFKSLRDEADEAFNALSAPAITPSQWRYMGGGQLIANPSFVRPGSAYRASAAPAAPPVNMAMYNDRCGG